MEEEELGLPEPDSEERRLNIQMPAELVGGTYANFANVSFSPYEFTLTFARIEHEVEEGDVPGAVVAQGQRLGAVHPGADRGVAGLVVEVRDARGHPEPARGAGPLGRRLGRELTLSLVPSYAVLCAVQAATVAAPARQARAVRTELGVARRAGGAARRRRRDHQPRPAAGRTRSRCSRRSGRRCSPRQAGSSRAARAGGSGRPPRSGSGSRPGWRAASCRTRRASR